MNRLGIPRAHSLRRLLSSSLPPLSLSASPALFISRNALEIILARSRPPGGKEQRLEKERGSAEREPLYFARSDTQARLFAQLRPRVCGVPRHVFAQSGRVRVPFIIRYWQIHETAGRIAPRNSRSFPLLLVGDNDVFEGTIARGHCSREQGVLAKEKDPFLIFFLSFFRVSFYLSSLVA